MTRRSEAPGQGAPDVSPDRLALAPGAITDVAGLLVGHAAVAGRPTGCTVVLYPAGAVAGVAVRGGAPGTRETDLLRPENTVQQVHAILLTGGSAFGLDAVGGVMRWLEAHGHGLPVGPARVPIVPAAVLFDLWIGDARIRPDATTGQAACEAASSRPPAQGCFGAGLGATVGKLLGLQHAMKGGIGTASLQLGGITVGALVAVNAIGDIVDAQGGVLAGARRSDGAGFANLTQALLAGVGPAHWMAGPGSRAPTASDAAERPDPSGGPGSATTIGIVATDALLDKAGATQLAALAQHGLSRAVQPITANDGDTLFALATGGSGRRADISALGALAAEAVALAIRNAVKAADSLDSPPLPALRHVPWR